MIDCIFCAIASGDAPAKVHSANGKFLVFEPLNPVTSGHLLVIPRTHVSDAIEDAQVTADTIYGVALTVQRLRKFHPEYRSVNIITSVGSAATQTVFHLHVHIVPRQENDNLTLPWTGQEK